MKELSIQEFSDLSYEEQYSDKYEICYLFEDAVKGGWYPVSEFTFSRSTLKDKHMKIVYRLKRENTANELVRDFGFKNLIDMYSKLKFTTEQINALEMRIRYERQLYYEEGFKEGEQKVQTGLKKLLGIKEETQD